jgi:hypothetical protein
MALILLVLLLALLLGGLGFAVHILWWIALIVLVIWLLGFLVRVGEGGSRGRWYRWLSIGPGLYLARPADELAGLAGIRARRRPAGFPGLARTAGYCHRPRGPGTMCE